MLPYKKTTSAAQLYLNEGHPFTDLADSERDLLAQAVKVRNAIAHRSAKATGEFRNEVEGVDALPPSQRHPGAFLRSVFRRAPLQRRLDLYFNSYLRTLKQITAEW